MSDHHVILAEMREICCKGGLEKADAHENPFTQFHQWLNEAVMADIVEPNAMTLATSDATGRPSVRTVLLKGFDERGFCFFTNYRSRKAQDLESNPRASLLLHWREHERQVTISGSVERTTARESEAYFKTRPHGAQVGAWVSASQSAEIKDREQLEAREMELLEKWPPGTEVPLPESWGGYRLCPEEFEFWQGRPNRLHDRLRYRKAGDKWNIVRLSP